MPGVDTGLVGFEDVTGRRGVTEEDVEAMEQARASDLTLRSASALGLVALLLGSLYLGGWWFTSFLTLAMLVALGEFYSTLRKLGYAPLALVGLLGMIGMPVLSHTSSLYASAGVAVSATVIVVLVYSLVARRHPLDNAAVTVFGMMWVGLLTFAVPIAASPHPFAYILFLGLVTAMIDIGSYAIGRGFGRRALSPTLSPNKTVEGFIGGLVAGVLTAAVLSTFPTYEEIGFTGSLVLGAVIAVVAPIGDLAESMVKRSLGVKDMGSVLPGHGGMLDRIDSFLFAVPAAFVFFHVNGLL
jgi:phosphatidate cytidylyltransferase